MQYKALARCLVLASALAGCQSLGMRDLGLRKSSPPRSEAKTATKSSGAQVRANGAQRDPERKAAVAKAVFINAKRLSQSEVSALERLNGGAIPAGRYWYDARAGVWGMEGGPTVGRAVPGLSVGGSLRADASHGTTGVFVNGRELHVQDVLALQTFTVVVPGRYWVDALGSGGYEGGPAIFNLNQLAQAKAQQSGQRSGGAWSYRSKWSDVSVVSDGQGFFHYNDRDTSYSIGD